MGQRQERTGRNDRTSNWLNFTAEYKVVEIGNLVKTGQN